MKSWDSNYNKLWWNYHPRGLFEMSIGQISQINVIIIAVIDGWRCVEFTYNVKDSNQSHTYPFSHFKLFFLFSYSICLPRMTHAVLPCLLPSLALALDFLVMARTRRDFGRCYLMLVQQDLRFRHRDTALMVFTIPIPTDSALWVWVASLFWNSCWTHSVDTKTAHFLKQDYKVFDAPFFSITPKEAEAMDPTHRMLLEVTYEGFENGMLMIPC